MTIDASHEDGYLLSGDGTEVRDRLTAIAALFNPSTFRHMGDLGLAPGWRCWEVGAGGTSVVQWMAQRTGPTGYVLATDVDVTWATEPATADLPPTVEVRRHDVALEPPPDGGFHLAHARLVLVHLPGRDTALASMVAALRPGGWLLVEDADPALQPLSCPDELGPEQVLANKLRSGFRALLAGRGADLAYGRTLPRRLRAAGLTDVAADASFPVALPACAHLEVATINVIRPQLIDHGIATEADIDRHLANVAAGKLDLTQPPMVSCWGRRPL